MMTSFMNIYKIFQYALHYSTSVCAYLALILSTTLSSYLDCLNIYFQTEQLSQTASTYTTPPNEEDTLRIFFLKYVIFVSTHKNMAP